MLHWGMTVDLPDPAVPKARRVHRVGWPQIAVSGFRWKGVVNREPPNALSTTYEQSMGYRSLVPMWDHNYSRANGRLAVALALAQTD